MLHHVLGALDRGVATHVTVFGGPPFATMVLFSSATVWLEQFLAVGCALKTTAFPAASMPSALQMIVDVGFVHGVMAPITPYGAGSQSVRPWSP